MPTTVAPSIVQAADPGSSTRTVKNSLADHGSPTEPGTQSATAQQTERTKFRTRFFQLAIAMVFLLGFAGAGVAYQLINKAQFEEMRDSFEEEAGKLLSGSTAIVDGALRNAQTIAATMTLRNNLTRSEFTTLTELGGALIPGIQGISWIPRVLNESIPNSSLGLMNRTEFEEYGKTQFGSDFAIKPSTFYADQYMIVFLIEPYSSNSGAVGFNLFSSAARKTAMEKARDEALAVVTTRLTLVQEDDGLEQYGVLYITPVYASTLSLAGPLYTATERQDLHVGYVNGVLRIGDLIGNNNDYVNMYVFDDTSLPLEQTLLYPKATNATAKAAGAQTDDEIATLIKSLDARSKDDIKPEFDLRWTSNFAVADKQWLLVLTPKQALYDKYNTYIPIIWFMTIVFITFLFAGGGVMMLWQIKLDAKIHEQKQKLLNRLLPRQISERITAGRYEFFTQQMPACVCMFLDIVGFTQFTAKMQGPTVLDMLKDIFGVMDSLLNEFGVEKIKTIGDCYMAANGLFSQEGDREGQLLKIHAIAMTRFALSSHAKILIPLEEHGLSIRIGINGGQVLCGVLGGDKPHFDIWGDAVNMASRLEASSVAGRIQIAAPLHNVLKDEPDFELTPRNQEVLLKGKGMTKTWFVNWAGEGHTNLPMIEDADGDLVQEQIAEW